MNQVATLKQPNTLMSKMAARLNVPEAEMLQTLKATAFRGNVSDAQMTALLVVANEYNLNPFTREIYAFPDRNNGIVPVVGVDGWARIINENPHFDGMDFEQDAESCTCIIYRKDRAHPIKVTEYLAECKRDTQPWKSHPRRMLRHKSMIQCARVAFAYTGIYDEDEAERIINPSQDEDISSALEAIKKAKTMDELQKVWSTVYKEFGANKALTEAKDNKKKELQESVTEGEFVEVSE